MGSPARRWKLKRSLPCTVRERAFSPQLARDFHHVRFRFVSDSVRFTDHVDSYKPYERFVSGRLDSNGMNPSPRQLELVEEVQRLRSVSVEALAERFGVTLQTVRRDVRLLAEAGLLKRFHGGVRVPSSTTENINYRQRQQLNDAAKRCIAKAVAQAARGRISRPKGSRIAAC